MKKKRFISMENTKTALLLQVIPIIVLLTFITSFFFGEDNAMAFIIFSLSWMTLSCSLIFGIAGISWMRKAKVKLEKGWIYIAVLFLSIFNLIVGLLTIATFAAMLILSA